MTPSLCQSCSRLRPPMDVRRLVTEVLDLAMPNRLADLLDELERWFDDERRREADVTDRASSQDAMDRPDWTPDWPRRPVAHAYCGARADRPRIADLVIATAPQCPDARHGDPPDQDCRTCRFLSEPSNPLLDLHARASGSEADMQLLERADRLAEGVTKSEATEAFKSRGVCRTEPRYLPVCTRLSRPGAYVVGPIVNWTRACGWWERKVSP